MGKYRREVCAFAGCEKPAGRLTGFCIDHYLVAYPCVIGGCDGRVAAWSRSRECKAHRGPKE